ncbi:Hypothetical predicted protein [Prunus dulcis]|uniref:Uncharacterized protein n=1 Tax=Prunus dulcis TaxID=3755 RepID=A0A5E4G996_PRUDU|nr:hypothetical protein L3X38_040734 [Prunus dulcis]KAI5310955.1 hypothetical protein L3X38_045478 [Prunus dulcis]VVA36168.1 Hypothetical predicted protein [Prunus dulcis]
MGEAPTECLASWRDVADGPLVLASIYKGLKEATIEPINLNVNGQLGMVQALRMLIGPRLLRIWRYSHVSNRDISPVVEKWTPEIINMVWSPIIPRFSTDSLDAPSYQTFHPAIQLATGKGQAAGEALGSARPKTPIFVQRKRNLVNVLTFFSPIAKVVSPSNAIEQLGTRKRSLPKESVSVGDMDRVQPEATQRKWARTSPAKTPWTC